MATWDTPGAGDIDRAPVSDEGALEHVEHVLAVDVGNTSTRFGLLAVRRDPAAATSGKGGWCVELVGSGMLTTPGRLTVDEARIQLRDARSLMPDIEPEGSILSCVVPTLSDSWRAALAHAFGRRPMVVGPGLKTGVRMRYDDPSEVGADRVADIVAARATYGCPVVVIDLGTTTNFEVIDERGDFIGGVIAPGIALGARALTEAAARLPVIELHEPAYVIGRNTRAAMQSGVVFGEAARIDGLLDALMGEMGGEAKVVMTGSGAEDMVGLLAHDVTVDDTLTLRGLALLWALNRR